MLSPIDRACCILHNLCIQDGDAGDWLQQEDPQRARVLMEESQQDQALADAGEVDARMGSAPERRRGMARRKQVASRL